MQIFILSLLVCVRAYGQGDDTMTAEPIENKPSQEIKSISQGRHHSGGFGAISFKGSKLDDDMLMMAGIRGGWIIGRTLAIGFEGYGIIPTIEIDKYLQSNRLVGGYGGVFLEPIFFSNEIVHVTFPLAAGAGWVGIDEEWGTNDYDENHEILEQDVFWYIEPGVTVEINLTRHVRLNMGVTKRFLDDHHMEAFPSEHLEKPNYMMTLKFGRF